MYTIRGEIGDSIEDLLAGAPRTFRHLYLSEGGQFTEITLAFCFRDVEFCRGSGDGGAGATSLLFRLIPQQRSILQIRLKMSLRGSIYIAASKPLISTHI